MLWGIPDFGPPATADDLVAEALELGFPATRRLITSWTEAGLLCSPSFRKHTRHGSASRLYPPGQRQLFVILLQIRAHLPSGRRRELWRTMSATVLWMWLHELLPVPTTQVRRALRTLAVATGAPAARTSRELVAFVAHPSVSKRQYRKAVAVVEQALLAQEWNWDVIESALTEVCSPWPAPPGQRVERGLSVTEWLFGVREAVHVLRTGVEVVDAFSAESVSEHELDRARRGFVLRRGEEDLEDAWASMNGHVRSEALLHPIDRAVGLFMLEVGQVLDRRAGAGPGMGGREGLAR